MSETNPSESDVIEGYCDGYDNGVFRGWAWYPARPETDALIEVLVDGQLVAEGFANLRRGDLATAGKRKGDCAFAVVFPLNEMQPPRTAQITVRSKDGQALQNGEFAVDIAERFTPMPVPFEGPVGVFGYIDQFGPDVIAGWISWPGKPPGAIDLGLWEAGEQVGTVVADIWRTDIEEAHQGDGRWGFEALVPPALRDGEVHVIELSAGRDRRPITGRPIEVRLPLLEGEPIALPDRHVEDDARSEAIRPPRHDVPDEILFTVIVNFYNMAREAARTLTSLSRSYQQGIGDLRYEVICIDNGSTPPLDQAWVESFGPEFRLLRPSTLLSSPCAAINEAARQAKGRYVAIMIDGAHVLTPGVFREVWDAVDDTPDAVIGLRQWFVGGDQRWLSISGYSREQEDILFERIFWPQDGYRLFKIGTPIWESPNHWLDGMIESNCLFVPRTIYERIGGMDEAFDEPGGGYANLDLFKRAVEASPEPVIALLGEASFHQFHEGTTTNVADTEKDLRVRGYENNYMLLRGEHYVGIRPVDIRQRGQLRAQSAVVGRQRPLSPARLGVTDTVRKGSLPLHFDGMSVANLQSVYVECGLHRLTKWGGHAVGVAPADVIEIQDIAVGVRPGRIVAVNAGFGVVNMLDSFLRMAGLNDSKILWVGARDAEGKALPASVELIAGEPYAPETVAAVERALALEEDILVLFAPRPDDYTPIDPLRSYARFVSCRSYLIFLGTVFGQPWLGYSKYWFQAAVKAIVGEMPFVIDHSRNQQLVTVSPNGYLQRILTTPATSMDDLAEFDDL